MKQLLPKWLKDLDKLVLLDLDDNDFTGTIPTEIGNMISLTFLLLNRNKLKGNVPTELGFVTDLRKYRISSLGDAIFLSRSSCLNIQYPSNLIFRGYVSE